MTPLPTIGNASPDGPLSDLADYLQIFEEAASGKLKLRSSGGCIIIELAGETIGWWRRDGTALVFEGDRDGYTLVYSTQAAVLHTLNRIGTHLDLNGIED